jgi:flagellar hook protein FlgE
MVRSLYCGISGLRNHQVALDVTGNNIANVNTVGFKAGRVTFEESMAQMLRGSSRPPGMAGGTNPIQVGLGMSIGAIDNLQVQGNLQSTGQITDLAIEGRSFFVFSNGEGNFYSRNGGLQLDSNGKLVCPTNGFVLQGMMAASDGTFPIGTRIGDLRIPFGEKAPAQETSEIEFACNLDSDSEALGTVTNTNRFLAIGAAADLVNGLYDGSGNALGIRPGDTLTIRAYDDAIPAPNEYTRSFTVDATTSIQSIVDEINQLFIVDMGVPQNSASFDPLTGMVNINTVGGTAVNNLSVRSNRPGSDSFVSNVFYFGPIPAGTAAAPSARILAPAEDTDMLADVFDAAGNVLGLEDGDLIQINGSVGGATVPTGQLVYDSLTTDLRALLDEIQQTFRLPMDDGTPQRNPSVSMNLAGTDSDRIPDGSIVVRGQREEAFALTNLSIIASNGDLDATAPTRFNANTGFTEIQAARDTGRHSTSIVVYDESGDAHTVTTTFTHSGFPGLWLWEVSMDGGEQIIAGQTGRIMFGQDGTPAAFTFDDQSTAFVFDPMNGSNEVRINMNVGAPGSLEGITQFRSPSTTAARSQDGYPMGRLQEISIDEYGMISGLYTNGISKAIAQIYVAEFNNSAGLLKLGDSMFALSNNSGDPVMLVPGVGSSSKLKPGALEMSNVELATEFTSMITIQRGYQANARVITTSDNMLQELVQLVR